MRLSLVLPLLVFAFTPAIADDADTLTVDGTVYRLEGVDAPELDQYCVDKGGAYPCGLFAAEGLQELIDRRPVHCQDLGRDPEHPFRRIGHCTVGGVDINHWLVQQGWAINIDPLGRYAGDEREARERPLSIWRGCFLAPHDFRHGRKLTATLLGRDCPPDARAKLLMDYAVSHRVARSRAGMRSVRALQATAASITSRGAAATGARPGLTAGSARRRRQSPPASVAHSRAGCGDGRPWRPVRVGTRCWRRRTGHRRT
jgi:endonuclease YncB( thermonuclease family)